MKRRLGFTLIELLVVMGILTILLSITVIAINPYEYFAKANDVAIRAAIYDINNASGIYLATEKIYPWDKNSGCKNEIDSGGAYLNMGNCIKELTDFDVDDLSITEKKKYEKIHVSRCKDQAVMCYIPKSKDVIDDAIYDKWGVVNPGCPGDKSSTNETCYWCKRVKTSEVCETPPHATLSATLTPTPYASQSSSTPTPSVSIFPSPAPDISCATEPEYDPKFYVGYCGVRRATSYGYTPLPGTYVSDGFAVPDLGDGYARKKIINYYPVSEYVWDEYWPFVQEVLRPSCTVGVQEALMRSYCSMNSEPAFWENIFYKSNGCKSGNGNLAINLNLDYCENYEQLPQEENDANCNKGITKSLEFTTINAKAGDTVNQKLIVTNNNSASCTPTQYVTSYAHYKGHSIIGLPNSFYISGGETKEFPFGIYVSSSANPYWAEEYRTFNFWVYPGIESGESVDTIINITSGLPTPTDQKFSNFGGKFYEDYATFEYSYNGLGNIAGRIDIALDPALLEETNYQIGEPIPTNVRYGFAYNTGSAWDSSNSANPSSIRGFIVTRPSYFAEWKCGTNFYYRMYNAGDLRIKSEIQTGTVDCNTNVDILPWDPWYDAIYNGIYDERYDVNKNAFVDWDDYWILVRDTRLR